MSQYMGFSASWCDKYSIPGLKRPLKKNTKIGFEDWLSLNASQKWEHSPLLSTFIKLLFVFKIFVLFILCGRFKQTCFTVPSSRALASYISDPVIHLNMNLIQCTFVIINAGDEFKIAATILPI